MEPPLTSSHVRQSTISRRDDHDQHASGLCSESFDLWEHAALLYHSYEWQEAADVFLYLTRQIHQREPRTLCFLNAGIIQARLGDFTDAARTIEAAVEYNDGYALFPLTLYLLGIVEWELSNVIKAEASLQVSLNNLRGSDISYAVYGIDFVLKLEDVRQQLDTVRTSLCLSSGQNPEQLALQILSAECIFEAPPRLLKPKTTAKDSVPSSKLAERTTSPGVRVANHLMSSDIKPHEIVGKFSKKPRSVSDSTTRTIKPQEAWGRVFESTLTKVEPPDSAATSLSGPAYQSSWHRRPTTPYIPRDARGEYEGGQEVALFLHQYRMSRPVPLDPRVEEEQASSPKEPAKTIRMFGQESSQAGLLLSKQRILVPQKSLAVNGEAHDLHSQHPGWTDISRDFIETNSIAGATVVARWLKEPDSLAFTSPGILDGSVRSDSTMAQREPVVGHSGGEHPRPGSEVREILLPTVYVPSSKAWARSVYTASVNSIELLTYEESRQPGNYFDSLHTAASSTSNLFRDSMATVDRTDLARATAMNLLEGRPRVQREVLPKVSSQDIAQEPLPLPPHPNLNRIDSVAGNATTQVRVRSSQIFDYMRKV